MQIYINKNGRQLGPFDRSKVDEMLRFGQISPTDFAIKQGDKSWSEIRNLFVETPQVIGANQTEFNNLQVVGWAKQRLFNPVIVNHKQDSIFARVVWFGVLFFIPAMFFIFGIYNFFVRTTSGNPATIFVLATVLTIPFALIWLIMRHSRSKNAMKLNSSGVELRNGKMYAWKDLYEVKFSQARNAKVNNNPLAMIISSIIIELMFAGNNRTVIELIFANGKAVIPPLIRNQQEMIDLFADIPAKVSGNK